METICDYCGKTIPDNEICYGTANDTLCGKCMDEFPDAGEAKKQIDQMSYQEMLQIWRHGSAGENPLLAGSIGKYFKDTMFEKKAQLSHEEQVATSKIVGW